MGQEGAGFLAARSCAEQSVEPVSPMEEASEKNTVRGEGELEGVERRGEDALGQEVAAEADEEEGRIARGLAAPVKVTRQEREDHEKTHTPYRAWCQYCVKGRGRNAVHGAKKDLGDIEREVPRVSMDYFFMSDADEKASANPLIVMVDEGTGEKYARAVGRKGVGDTGEMDWLIKDMSDELKAWGHPGGGGNSLILKSDGEKAIVAVRTALGQLHGGRIVPESPAKGESPSNGVVEEAGKTIREFTRVMKEQLEDKAQVQLEPGDIVVQWMIRWAAMLVSRYMVGKDGRTGYERRRGRKCKIPVVAFGEKVWYREARDTKERKDKFCSEWREGLWLGHARNSNEIIVGTTEGVVRAYAIKRQDDEHRWSKVLVKNMRGTPQQPNPLKRGIAIPVKVTFDPPASAVALPSGPLREERRVRRMKITGDLLSKYGYTEGCDGCRYKRAGLEDARPHSEQCRNRIREAMQGDAIGQELLKKEGDRIDNWLVKEIEKADKEKEKSAEAEGNAHQEQLDEASREEDVIGKGEAEIAAEEMQGAERQTQEERLEECEKEIPDGKRRRLNDDVLENVPAPEMEAASGTQDAVMEDTALLTEINNLSMGIYSPPRAAKEGQRQGFQAGEVLDLTTGWDFRRVEDRAKVWEYIKRNKPKLVVGSPMCAAGGDFRPPCACPSGKAKRWTEAKEHVAFVTEVYQHQAEKGHWFLHEHPATASSGSLRELQKVMCLNNVKVDLSDQHMHDLRTLGKSGNVSVKARRKTKFMTNCGGIHQEIQSICEKGFERQQASTARYSLALCRAICRGLARELEYMEFGLTRLVEVHRLCQAAAVHPKGDHEIEDMGKYAFDDVTGEVLDPKKVMEARAKEIAYIRQKKVWRKIRRSEAIQKGWKIVKTRWIDVNKGDKFNPNYRSRFVAKEYNEGEGEGLFASTPPLEALRMLLSEVATSRQRRHGGRQVIMVNDVARAFFEAPVKRTICIELPEEDRGDQDEVGLLEMSLYGTRDAAANFQAEVRKVMTYAGFRVSRYNPSTFYHPGRDLRCLVHGDDFITGGSVENIKWFRKVLEGRFEISTKVIGTGEGEVREGKVLNRVIRADSSGWHYEADQRHADYIIKAMNLEGAKEVGTPGEEEKPWKEAEGEEKLSDREATNFRALAARANYLALDRPDIQFSVKEICRGMANPLRSDLLKLRRLARYLIGRPRVVTHFQFQGEVDELSAFSDSDWAGCRRTAKSTSGGVIMRGTHYIKSWASTQKNITLSSGEAELVAAVKASAELIGVTQLASEWGHNLKGAVYVDSSAALGVVKRKGNGKLRHIRVGLLWIQEKSEEGEILYKKVRGECNPSDVMTKYLGKKVAEGHMGRMRQRFETGRAESSLRL